MLLIRTPSFLSELLWTLHQLDPVLFFHIPHLPHKLLDLAFPPLYLQSPQPQDHLSMRITPSITPNSPLPPLPPPRTTSTSSSNSSTSEFVSCRSTNSHSPYSDPPLFEVTGFSLESVDPINPLSTSLDLDPYPESLGIATINQNPHLTQPIKTF